MRGGGEKEREGESGRSEAKRKSLRNNTRKRVYWCSPINHPTAHTHTTYAPTVHNMGSLVDRTF
jgi:hypothetical protein